MKRMPFERPTNHYDERVVSVDERICALIRQRKDASNNNPGYPPLEKIEAWSLKFDLYEGFLKSLFGHWRNEEYYRPTIEPSGFRKHLPVLKTVEKDGDMYTVTFIRQYENASVVNFYVDSMPTESEEKFPSHRHRFFELFLGEGYDCRGSGGGGSQDHHTYQFVVTPPVPDNLSDLHFCFQEKTAPFGESTGFSVLIGIG